MEMDRGEFEIEGVIQLTTVREHSFQSLWLLQCLAEVE